MSGTISEVVLPPVCPAHEPLTFFCDMTTADAPRTLLATMRAWLRLSELAPEEVSLLIASGVTGEDAWYDLARKWMLEERAALQSHAQCLAALDGLQDVIARFHNVAGLLNAYLKASFFENDHEFRPQTASLH